MLDALSIISLKVSAYNNWKKKNTQKKGKSSIVAHLEVHNAN